ncbi:hypothetical protein RF11_02596 [Thelohanellus kitauei]|uniref:Uncharacterized protein n=1 Tax=Thelohanellus kitauei TaxID=669202 RepID=A0A0C2IG04_THEKT|nr:hypothetical protein RF11_02596 [Thelohanellus kitauei]
MINKFGLFLILINFKFAIQAEAEEDDFGGFIKNVFSRFFTSWPFNILDTPDFNNITEIEPSMGDKTTKGSAAFGPSKKPKITWYPVDFDSICKSGATDQPICGKNNINIKKICKQKEDGAIVKGYCSTLDKNDESASFSLTTKFMKAKNWKVGTMPELVNKTAEAPKIREEISEKSEAKTDHEKTNEDTLMQSDSNTNDVNMSQIVSNTAAKPETKSELTNIASVEGGDESPTKMDSKVVAKRDINYDTKYEKSNLKTGYSMSMYGIAMSSGALGTVLIVLLIVITYSVVRVMRIRNTQRRIERAKMEVCELKQKLSNKYD